MSLASGPASDENSKMAKLFLSPVKHLKAVSQ